MATIVHKNAIIFNGIKYDVKLNIKEVKVIGEYGCYVSCMIAKGFPTDPNDINLYSQNPIGFWPMLEAGFTLGGPSKVEVAVDYIVLDSNGREKAISGLFGMKDIDLAGGMYLDGFIANRDNTYMFGDSSYINYKIIDNKGTYFYDTSNVNIEDRPEYNETRSDAYILIKNKSKISIVNTWDGIGQGNYFEFKKDVIKRYRQIVTEVIGGTITPTLTGIKDGENRTITYSPNDSSRQYLKSVTVDGVEQSVDLFKNSYTFSNITEGHTIRVEYADLYKVTFDAKGGTPTPETQSVKPGEKATEPVTKPTKKGYTFEGWTLDEGSLPYNFDTPVNKDIKLVANWKPIVYKIDYVLNGGTNDKDNPTTYTIEDTINFKPATKEGFDFLGWYEDENFTTPIAGVSNRTGDITVYAKWEAKKDVAYKVEHYKETETGKYELAVTDTLSGSTNEEVTATPKTYTGYKENTTHKDRVAKGSIKEDGSLVLKLYYDKIKYTVTFDPQNDTKIPEQIVPYQDKVAEPTKPTKENNVFKYWYYKNEEGKEVIYNFDDPVTSDVHLIAKWSPIPASQKDATPAPTPIPQTGDFNAGMVFSIIAIVTLAGAFGIKYFSLKIK